MPTLSARQAAWLLSDATPPLPPGPASRVSAGEAERLELIDALAIHMQSCDASDLAVCRRLLQHLRGPQPDHLPTSRLQ